MANIGKYVLFLTFQENSTINISNSELFRFTEPTLLYRYSLRAMDIIFSGLSPGGALLKSKMSNSSLRLVLHDGMFFATCLATLEKNPLQVAGDMCYIT